jgi:hypothetical protein
MSTSNCLECGTALTERDECLRCNELKIDDKFDSCCSLPSKPIETKSGLLVLAPRIQEVVGGHNGKKH